jgi:hypothetical protein
VQHVVLAPACALYYPSFLCASARCSTLGGQGLVVPLKAASCHACTAMLRDT